MANELNRKRINVKGGGDLRLRETFPTPAASFTTVGFIADGGLTIDVGMVEAVDEAGRFVNHLPSTSKGKWTTTLMQTSDDEVNLLANAGEKFYEMYYVVALSDGTDQEWLFPVAKITPKVEMEFKAGTLRGLPLEIAALAPKIALTGRTPSSWDSAIWQAYVLQENSSPVGPPSDGGAVAAAAI